MVVTGYGSWGYWSDFQLTLGTRQGGPGQSARASYSHKCQCAVWGVNTVAAKIQQWILAFVTWRISSSLYCHLIKTYATGFCCSSKIPHSLTHKSIINTMFMMLISRQNLSGKEQNLWMKEKTLKSCCNLFFCCLISFTDHNDGKQSAAEEMLQQKKVFFRPGHWGRRTDYYILLLPIFLTNVLLYGYKVIICKTQMMRQTMHSANS